MALHRLLEIEIGVPDPTILDDFYQEIGLVGGNRSWGGPDLPGQIKIVEAPYRQLRSYRIGCEAEADLDAIAKRLDTLGAKYQVGGGQLKLIDPINDWEFIVEPAPAWDVPPPPKRLMNRPGERPRSGVRAEVLIEDKPRPPRPLGRSGARRSSPRSSSSQRTCPRSSKAGTKRIAERSS